MNSYDSRLDRPILRSPEEVAYEKIATDLKTKGYTEISLSMPRSEFEKAGESFLKFLSLPDKTKNLFTVMMDKNWRGSHAGYVRRSHGLGDSDNKEYFNYRLATDDLLEPVIEKHSDCPEVANFLDCARDIFCEARDTMATIISILAQKHLGIYHKLFFSDHRRMLCLRFVKYELAPKWATMANAHYDTGSCALAIAENRNGLRIGTNKQNLELLERSGNCAVFMPAITFPRDTGCYEFKPAWHDVIETSDGDYARGNHRWSIILFGDTALDHREIPYEESHTPKS